MLETVRALIAQLDENPVNIRETLFKISANLPDTEEVFQLTDDELQKIFESTMKVYGDFQSTQKISQRTGKKLTLDDL